MTDLDTSKVSSFRHSLIKYCALIFLFLCGIWSYNYIFPSRNQASLKLSVEAIIEALQSFINTLEVKPGEFVGNLECNRNGKCVQAVMATSGGRLWPLYAIQAQQRFKPSNSHLKNLNAYADNVKGILGRNEGTNPVGNLHVLYEAYEVSGNSKFLEPFVSIMGAEMLNLEMLPLEEENVFLDRSLMVAAQIVRQIGMFRKILDNTTLLERLRTEPVIRGSVLLEPESWRKSAQATVDKGTEIIQKDLFSDQGIKSDRADACWGLFGISARYELTKSEDDKKLLEKSIDKILFKDSSIFLKAIPSVQSLLPCVDIITRFDTPYFLSIKQGVVEQLLNKFFDSSERKLCLGDNGLIGNIPGSELSRCEVHTKSLADQSWLVRILSTFSHNTVFNLNLNGIR